MSSFKCEKCGAVCSDTERGYVSGCKHYPIDCRVEKQLSRQPHKLDIVGATPTPATISPCSHCFCMTKTIKGKCGKCGGKK